MKNSLKKMTLLLLLTIVGLTGCKKGFEELNTDPIGRGTAQANQLLAPALVSVLHANMVRNRNFNNELMQVTVDISDAEGKVFRYDFRRSWSDYLWNTWYPQLTNFRDMYTIASQPDQLNASYKGISLITQAWVYSLLTDTYGNVPYSQANQGKDGIVEPAYDAQKDIYLDLFNKLEEANTLLSEGDPIVPTSDPVFKGAADKWRKFGNSLYLRLLLRVSGKSEVSEQVIAKIKEMVDTNAGNYPIMQNNDDTAKILWNGTNSSTAVYSSPFMVSVRPVDFRSVAICSFFIDRLRDWGDPRLDSDFGKESVPRWGIAQGVEGYSGVPSGFGPGMDLSRKSYFYSDAQNNGYTLQTDPYTGIIMNAAEVNFILAEAAAKGWISGSAADYYNKGIFYGINYWLPTWASSPEDATFRTYLTDAEISWNDNLPLDAREENSKMEQIHIQKYYAMFLVDMQQWYEYRRTGHPILPRGAGLGTLQMPARMSYPIISQSANPTAYKNAIEVQGPDLITTQVWWQKP